MPVLKLPEPPGWAASGRRLAWVTAVFLLLVGLAFMYTARWAAEGQYLAAAGLGSLATCCTLIVVGLHHVAWGLTSLWADYDSEGTTLNPDRWYAVVIVVASLIGFVGVVLVVVAMLVTDAGDAFSRGARTAVTGLAVAGLVTLVHIFAGVWKRRTLGYVKLAPTGVDIADMERTASVEWDDVVEIGDQAESKKTRKGVALRLRDGEEKVIDGADFYVPRGTRMYWMMRHYWRHPEDRAELTDGRALQRLHDSRFDVG